MVVLLKRRKTTKHLVKGIKQTIATPIEKPKTVRLEQTVSTGSTLLDLAISGGRKREGGLPGGIIVEIFGPSSAGKTSILAEICASIQANGGEVKFLDPEARLDQEYARIYGVELNKDCYYRPDTVSEVFNEHIWTWEPPRKDVINGIGTDSLAALSTQMELDDKDKYGMRRAKEFSEGLRKTTRIIRNNNWLIVCTNQVREGEMGEVTPGGRGIPFYSSLRIRVGQKSKIEKVTKVGGKEVKKAIGIQSLCQIKKSTVDDPFREAMIYIIFNYGIDDVRGNLQYLKNMTGATKYAELNMDGFVSMDKAIRAVEKYELEKELREKVIDLWHEVEAKFDAKRRKKERI